MSDLPVQTVKAVDTAYIMIQEIALYDVEANVIPGLAAYQIKVGFGSPTLGGKKLLDTHWQESTAWECAKRWAKRYEQAGYFVRIL